MTEDLAADHPGSISRHVWETRYRYSVPGDGGDANVRDTWRRVARALAAPEADPGRWEGRFYRALEGFRFIPAGRILAGAGTGRDVTLFNCFVMGPVQDSVNGIMRALKEGALTMQRGGGIGYDFSTLLPAGTPAAGADRVAAGPVAIMRIWDAMCRSLVSYGARRGAMMATLRCDHPDIEQFIEAKSERHELRNFNLSVQVTDEFMQAVRENRDWPLVFPERKLDRQAAPGPGGSVRRHWPGYRRPVTCRVLRVVRARALWRKLTRAAFDWAEPGVLFIDRVNGLNNLWYRERIGATNPCGEIPLPAYGACDLGSVNLTRFVRGPFTANADLDREGIRRTVKLAVRMLDNVIDVSRYPLSRQAEQATHSRRIGLGLTGLADALIMLGLRYGGERSYEIATEVMRLICHTAYGSSVELAREKGAFPWLDNDRYLEGEFIVSLPDAIRRSIRRHGIRNSHLTAIAPTGTISLLAGNISSGIEPVFAFHHRRHVLERDNTRKAYQLEDYAWRLWQRLRPGQSLPEAFVSALDLPPEDHLGMQAALQPYVDNSISKTINMPAGSAFSEFRRVYEQAWEAGLKSCTVYRPSRVRGEVLHAEEAPVLEDDCCRIPPP